MGALGHDPPTHGLTFLGPRPGPFGALVRLDVAQTAQVYFPINLETFLSVAHDGSKWLEPRTYGIAIRKQHMHTVHLQGKPARWS